MENDLRVEQQVKLTWWPSPQDYNEAVQTPGISYEDPELQRGEAELNNLGIPKANTGNFASVYHVSVGKQEWAVRCFLRNVQGQRERYKHIEAAINESNAPFLARFAYVERGIRVHADWFPILKMEWVNGVSFIEHLQANLANPDILKKTAEDFKSMVIQMQACGIAHGDLQHGNIIVTADGLKLVDYDGMFVPNLAGEIASELGHRNYQHPKRQPTHFDGTIDNFSAWLIYSSIICLSEDASLFYKLGVGDECLLFKELDLKRPSISRTFDILENHPNATIQKHTRWMRSLLRRPVDQMPGLNDEIDETVVASLPEKPAVTQSSRRGAWLGAISLLALIGLLALWNIHISKTETEALDRASREASTITLARDKRETTMRLESYLAEERAAKDREYRKRLEERMQEQSVRINDKRFLSDENTALPKNLVKRIKDADSYLDQGLIVQDDGDVQRSDELFMKAIAIYEVHPQSQYVHLAECWHSIGHNFEKTNEWTKAIDAFKKSMRYLDTYRYKHEHPYERLRGDISHAQKMFEIENGL